MSNETELSDEEIVLVFGPCLEDVKDDYMWLVAVRAIIAAAFAKRDAAAQPLQGWVMVPIEPTEKMIHAFLDAVQFPGVGFGAGIKAAIEAAQDK